jgi:hypothetical protein
MGRTDQEPGTRLNVNDEPLDKEDWRIFNGLTAIGLTAEEEARATTPERVDEAERHVLALHFHPEWVPMGMVDSRLKRAFPNAETRLAIPTQHNQLQELDGFTGVEADVFAHEYGIKIQLLIHLKSDRLKNASAFPAMIQKTFQYRALQLLDFLDLLVEPDKAMQKDIKKLGYHSQTIKMGKRMASKLRRLVIESGVIGTPRAEMLKNRLLTDYIAKKGAPIDGESMDRLLSFVKQTKNLVKARVDPSRFYPARDLIEEARGLGAGVIIPHPPRFWPALLDDLDVDGWEVWNPSTPDHVLFLIDCLKRRKKIKRDLLAFMGDDTHMSSKIRPDISDKKESIKAEIGFQPPWVLEDVKAALKDAGQSRERTINEYLSRIS